MTDRDGRKDRDDITGQRFGMLTVTDRTEERRRGREVWLCQCDCGTEVKATANALFGGRITNCGCKKNSGLKGRARDLTGRRFGALTALEPEKTRLHGNVVWRCQCDCGNTCQVTSRKLVTGEVTSCGCLKVREEKEPPAAPVREDGGSSCIGVFQRDGAWYAELSAGGETHRYGPFARMEEAVDAQLRAGERNSCGPLCCSGDTDPGLTGME